jgi:hypothetical protein
MQAEIPIVAAANDAVLEVMGDNYPGLFPIRDHEKLCQLLILLEDSKFRESLVTWGKSRLTIFDPKDMARKVFDTYSLN